MSVLSLSVCIVRNSGYCACVCVYRSQCVHSAGELYASCYGDICCLLFVITACENRRVTAMHNANYLAYRKEIYRWLQGRMEGPLQFNRY